MKKIKSSRKLRICIVTNQLANVHSGQGTHARILAEELPKSGFDVTIVCPEEDNHGKTIANLKARLVSVRKSVNAGAEKVSVSPCRVDCRIGKVPSIVD